MSKQAKPIERTARLLDLIPFITSHQGIHIDELAKEFNTTAEVIANDLDLLFMCGLPSYTPLELIDLNYEGGFVTIRDAQNLDKPRKLNMHESASLLLGLSLLKSTAVSQERIKTIERLEEKLRSRLSHHAEQFISLHSENVGNYRELTKAITAEKTLKIRYLNQTKDEITERVISPLEIFLQSGRLHLLAFCHLANDQRVFDIGNIQSITPSIAEYRRGQRMHLLIDESQASVSLSYVGSGLNFIEQNPELIVAHDAQARTAVMKFWNTEWLLRSIMSFGGTVTLHEPKIVVNALKERVSQALAQYR